MPRVAIKKRQYKVSDFSQWIVGRMFALKLTQEDMGDALGISQPAFCGRLKSGFFTYADMLVLLPMLQATDEEILRFMKM